MIQQTNKFLFLTAISLSLSIVNNAYSENSKYEQPPILIASDIINEQLMEGPHHKVGVEVSVVRYGYQFSLKTDEGETDVWSKEKLIQRIGEAEAIAKLNEISQTGAFITSIAEAVKNPIVSTWNVVTKPITTITNLPGGTKRYLQGKFYRIKKTTAAVSKTIKGIGKDDEDEKNEESLTQQTARVADESSKEYLGYNKAKRSWAKKLKVDPYSDNVALQAALDRIAWATSLGSFATDVTIPSYAALNYTMDVQNIVWETPPIELEQQNDERLKMAGFDDEEILAFHDHPHYNITAKTAITLSIEALGDIAGLPELLDIVMAASDSYESLMMLKITATLHLYHKSQIPLERIEIRRGMIAAIDQNNTLILPIAVEYLHWTALAEELAEDKELQSERRELWLTGQATSTSKEKLTEIGWKTKENSLVIFKEE